MNGRIIALLVFATIIHPCAATPKQSPPSRGDNWQRAWDAAHHGETDTAQRYLNKAFGQGLSDDSLYYLWSEIYLSKGDLDTALALNYAVKPDSGSGLARKVLEQRYVIYSALGWTSEARGILKSLHGRSYMVLRRLIPECSGSLSLGIYHEENVADRQYPYPRAFDSLSALTNGNSSAMVQFGWRLSLPSSQGLQIGGKCWYAGSRLSVPARSFQGTDSADFVTGAFLRYSAFSDRFATGYGFSWKRDFLNNITSVHEVSISGAMITPGWLGSIDAAFQWEYPLGRNHYTLMVYADRDLNVRNTFGFSFIVSGFAEDKLQLQDDLSFMYVRNTTMYTDSTFGTPIRFKAQIPSSMGSTAANYCVPMSYWSINPQVHYQRQMSRKCALGLSLAYSASWYPEKYEWYDLRYQPGMEPRGLDVSVLNGSDRQLYWVRSIGANSSVLLDSLPVLFHDERRIDQAVSLGVSIRTSWGGWGDVILDAMLRRNFSTLMDSAPVDIQRWYANAVITWFFRFKSNEM
jgi:hypothetical protein